MKKVILNPLSLDQETIAKLDEQQLREINGGISEDVAAGSTGCGGGGSSCGSGGSGGGGGCGSGASTSLTDEA
ncbi:class I lanthipeptide [[Flexibacter] sp. ATCC 35208]|uniref:class I lanthipeptide n=1 Tax=[Flexibacter] sp. ATCC 35208 TaxID=1936242 RepID=UPI0009D05827|nr:class I lanthipeptide [[Flexibacter] sp. ATCC 35208]OMP81113.1 hypothetical protein BW716_00565 [[Flexibacter] sp. ATCC 35208]